MSSGPENLAYLGKGTRFYGLRPILGRARGRWELQWILRGEARPTGEETRHSKTKGPRLYISHPGSPHGWTDDGSRSSEVFVLHFKRVPPELGAAIKPAKTLMVELTERETSRFRARLEEAWEMVRSNDARRALKLEQILVEVALLVLEREISGAPKSRPANRVEQALHWFEENIGENPSADAVARTVGVSPAHLRRLFAAAGRAAPKTELTRVRMAVAQRCLGEGWKLDRVASYLGFSEASAFSRAFSAACGLSPRQWLKREGRRPGPTR